MGKKAKKQMKNDLPVLDSGHDFFKTFEKNEESKEEQGNGTSLNNPVNRHGVKVIDDLPEKRETVQNPVKEDFAELLEESFKKSKIKKNTKKSTSMSLKKRLKRYPLVELELDLHGYNTIGAQMKTKSFISTCKHNGYFTIRIIVGKGLHSDIGPVLPDVVEDVLKEMKKKEMVIFYEWDGKKKSNSGAVIVYLKQFERFD